MIADAKVRTDIEDGVLFADSNSNDSTNFEGSCHCGQIEWNVRLDNPQHILCHCDTCKKLGGGPFSCNQIVAKDDLRITRGSPKIYTYTGASGKGGHLLMALGMTLTGCRQPRPLLPLFELYVTYLSPADDRAGEDHCADAVTEGWGQDGATRGDIRRGQFGLGERDRKCSSSMTVEQQHTSKRYTPKKKQVRHRQGIVIAILSMCSRTVIRCFLGCGNYQGLCLLSDARTDGAISALQLP